MKTGWLCIALLATTPADGTLVPAPDMSAPRMGHSATPLRDGRVLLAGGFVERASPRGAQLFDARAGRLLPLPAMHTTRHSHTATLLADGRVLIAGGYGEGTSYLASAELFDPASNTFVATGSMRGARAGHVAVLLESGQVLVVGGVGPGWTFLSSAELYDPTTGRFSPVGDMTTPRESHVAVRLKNGKVLVIGGHRDRRENITLYASSETYDPATRTFTRSGDMGIRRHKHDAVVLEDGRVLVNGGSDERDDRGLFTSTEFYDQATGRFTPGPSMRLGRFKHAGTSVVLPSGRVLIGGGAAQAETYDPRTNTFSLVLGEPRMAGSFSAVALIPGGGALISGGYGNGTGPRASAWLYRP